MTRRLSLLLLGSFVLLGSSVHVFAGPQSAPIEKATMRALDPSDPAHAAIMRWHRALLANDFPAYAQVIFHTSQVNDGMSRVMFDGIRNIVVPRTILISEAAEKIERLVPKGVKVYALVGCMKLPGAPHEVRLMAVVNARIFNGQWKVGGASFGTPSAEFDGACPLKPS